MPEMGPSSNARPLVAAGARRTAWLLAALTLAAAQPAAARTPTRTDGPSPTPTATASPTPTGTRPPYVPHIVIRPNPARSGQRVRLNDEGTILQSPLWSQSYGDVAITIENATATTASFIAPPVDAPTGVGVRLASPSLEAASFYDYEVTILPANMIGVQIGTATGPPGGRAEVEVRLDPYGLAVAGLHHRIDFDPAAAIADRGDGVPDCDLGPGLDAGAFTFLPTGCQATGSCTTLVADLDAHFHPITAPSVAYRCRVTFTDLPADSCFHALRCGGGDATASDGSPLIFGCADGGVVSNYQPTDPSVTFQVDPAEPTLGDDVRITFSVNGYGGIPSYQLLGAGPFLSGEMTQRADRFGDVVFDLRAECPGTTTLHLATYYETTGGCPGHLFFYFVNALSPGFPLRIRDPDGVALAGTVHADPDFCRVPVSGVTVTLEPLGYVTTTAADGTFHFDPLPPGTYTLRTAPLCNEVGCWPAQPVQVAADNVEVDLCATGRTGPCPGDCNEDDRVAIDELIVQVRFALGARDRTCAAADINGSGDIEITELISAVNAALVGCPPFRVTPSATVAVSPTPTLPAPLAAPRPR